MKVAAYVRVSTVGQRHDSQEEQIRSYCESRKWTITQWFRDKASGAADDRPGVEQMETLVKQPGRRDWTGVVVFKLDRLGRSLVHLVRLVDDFRRYDVEFASATQPIDSSDPAGRMMLHLLAAFSEYEREVIRERAIAGQLAARARGKIPGRRPVVPAKDIEEMVGLRLTGLSWQKIQRAITPEYPLTTIRRTVAAELEKRKKAATS